MQDINNAVQTFSQQMTNEAGQVFGSANTVFNNIMGAVKGIVAGGPSQTGMSDAELAARTAANVQANGAAARNMKGAAASSVAAIGGGNTVTPGGSTQAIAAGATQAAAANQAQGQNQIVNENFEEGRSNFFKALGSEESAPSVYGTANQFNNEAGQEQQVAEKSQQNIDTQTNWWKPLIVNSVSSILAGQMPGSGGSSSSKSSQSPDSDEEDTPAQQQAADANSSQTSIGGAGDMSAGGGGGIGGSMGGGGGMAPGGAPAGGY
jgi:hypothetical protein